MDIYPLWPEDILMEVRRTESIWLGPDKGLGYLCHLSKNLYNEATYKVRQEKFATGRWVRYYELWTVLKNSPNYKGLPAQTAQQTLRTVDACWKAYRMAIADYMVNPEKYLAMPRFPGYKKKDGEFILVFTNQQVNLKNGLLRLTNGIVEVRTRLPNGTKVTGARIIPRGIGYMLEITYDKEVKEKRVQEKENPIDSEIVNDSKELAKPCRALGIDPGLENLLATVNNIGVPPIVFKGGPVKSMNQFYNKRRAELQRQYARQGIDTGPKMQKLSLKRNRKINCFFHLVSIRLILYCKMWEIDTIVLGRNKLWKQEINLGKRTNQNFVSIPFYKLYQMIKYKAEEAGIRVIEIEEAYTSMCSFLDWESIEHHEVYMGKRIKRGLFRSAKGILINADVNGAYNHLRNAIPESMEKLKEKVMADGIEAVGIHPVRAVLD